MQHQSFLELLITLATGFAILIPPVFFSYRKFFKPRVYDINSWLGYSSSALCFSFGVPDSATNMLTIHYLCLFTGAVCFFALVIKDLSIYIKSRKTH